MKSTCCTQINANISLTLITLRLKLFIYILWELDLLTHFGLELRCVDLLAVIV